jgi:putative membrane protein
MMYGWHQSGWGPGAWIVMVVAMLLFWSVVVVGVVMAVRYFRAPDTSSSDGLPGAEEALRTRFARGEIDEEEYKRRMSVLRGEA